MLIIDKLLHQNIFIRRNNNFILDLQYKPNGEVFNTANVVRTYLQIRPYKNSNTMFLQVSDKDKVITYSGVDGGIHINIPYATTRDLPKFDEAFYDIIVFTTGNLAKTIMEGQIQVERSVGRIYEGPVGDSSGTGNNNPSNGYIPVWDDILEKPIFSEIAITGSYNSLTNKPILFDGKYASLSGKPVLSTVALTGSYKDLKDRPVDDLPAQYSYNDLRDKPLPLTFRGTWNPVVAYDTNNIVFWRQCSFVCLVPNTGIDPFTNNASSGAKVWQILAGNDGSTV
jgi:hypothetical protein